MTLPRRTRAARNERGQGLVEFALVAPIFFLIIFAIIQLGLMLGAQNGLVSAVRETARYAATFRVGDTADATAACSLVSTQLTQNMQRMMPGWNPGAPQPRTITYHWVANPSDTASYFVELHISSSYALQLYVPIVSFILDNAAPHPSALLTASEQMRIENQPLPYSRADVPCT